MLHIEPSSHGHDTILDDHVERMVLHAVKLETWLDSEEWQCRCLHTGDGVTRTGVGAKKAGKPERLVGLSPLQDFRIG